MGAAIVPFETTLWRPRTHEFFENALAILKKRNTIFVNRSCGLSIHHGKEIRWRELFRVANYSQLFSANNSAHRIFCWKLRGFIENDQIKTWRGAIEELRHRERAH